MRLDGDYLESVLEPEPVRVYGYRLGVLRMCHVVGLALMDSPVLRGEVPTGREVLLAARVCAAPGLKEVARLVSGPVRARERWEVWWRGLRWGRCAAAEWMRWAHWLAREDSGPRMLPQGQGGERLASPWVELLVGRMCAGGRASEPEAWRMRVCRVLWADVAMREERSGRRASLLSEQEAQQLVEMGWDAGELGLRQR